MIIQLIFSLHLPKRIARVFNAVCEVSLIINSSSSLSWLASSSFCLWRLHPSVCRGDRALGQPGLWGPRNHWGASGNPQLLAARLHWPGTATGPSKPLSLPAPSPPWYLSLCSSCTASRAQSCPLSFFIPYVSPTSPAPFFCPAKFAHSQRTAGSWVPPAPPPQPSAPACSDPAPLTPNRDEDPPKTPPTGLGEGL